LAQVVDASDEGDFERRRQISGRSIISILTSVVLLGVGFSRLACPSGRGLGQYAMRAEECQSGRLLSTPDRLGSTIGGVCTEPCNVDSDCSNNTRCSRSSCVPKGYASYRAECSAEYDCASEICLQVTTMSNPLAYTDNESRARAFREMPKIQRFCSKICGSD